MRRSIYTIFLLLLFIGNAHSNENSKIVDVIYDPDKTTTVKVKAGTATLIKLDDDEWIGGDSASGFAIGYPLAWDISVKKNNVFMRPKEEQPDTNIIFTTNKRTYSLILSSVAENEDPTFILRYKYPQEEARKIREKNQEIAENKRKERQKIQENNVIPCGDGGWINTDYEVRGSKDIIPLHIWDDGTFTCFAFSSSSNLPVVYKQFENKKEQLTNSHMKKNILVVHEVSKNFILRFGDSVLEVKTDKNIKKGFNNKATTLSNQHLISK